VVFVVLILPTAAFGGPGCGDNHISIKSITPTHASPGDGKSHQVVIALNHAYEVENVYIGVGKNQVTVSTWDYTSANYGPIAFTVPDGATTGKVVLASSTTDCLEVSKQTLHIP
jgi:hypothetical protein